MDGQGCHTAACTFFTMLMDAGLPLTFPTNTKTKTETHCTSSNAFSSIQTIRDSHIIAQFNITVQLRKSIRHGRILRSCALVKEEININSSIMTSFIIHFKAPVFKIVDGAGRSCTRTGNACLNPLFRF